MPYNHYQNLYILLHDLQNSDQSLHMLVTCVEDDLQGRLLLKPSPQLNNTKHWEMLDRKIKVTNKINKN